MEEVIQIILFIAVVTFVMVKNYKEVRKNRPKQSVQPASHSSDSIDTVFPNENFEEIDENFPEDMFTEEKEVFDEVDFDEKDFSIKEEKLTTSKAESILKKPQEYSELKNSFQPSNAVQPQSATVQPSNQLKHEPLIQLKSRKEARKAFIYSEIFNRRYK